MACCRHFNGLHRQAIRSITSGRPGAGTQVRKVAFGSLVCHICTSTFPAVVASVESDSQLECERRRDRVEGCVWRATLHVPNLRVPLAHRLASWGPFQHYPSPPDGPRCVASHLPRQACPSLRATMDHSPVVEGYSSSALEARSATPLLTAHRTRVDFVNAGHRVSAPCSRSPQLTCRITCFLAAMP